MALIAAHCDISTEMYQDKALRESLEEDLLTMVIREHGKVITMRWIETFSDNGDLVHRLALTYEEKKGE
jgi:hypothetical protein